MTYFTNASYLTIGLWTLAIWAIAIAVLLVCFYCAKKLDRRG